MSTTKMTAGKATRGKAAKPAKGFTAEERAAMKERVQELRAAKGDGDATVLAKIASMPEPDRAIGKKLHALVRTHAPNLVPKLWYGMPAYARGDKVVCFYQNASKFKSRYGTFNFTDKARLDDGRVWATGFAVTDLGAADEERLAAMLRKAVG